MSGCLGVFCKSNCKKLEKFGCRHKTIPPLSLIGHPSQVLSRRRHCKKKKKHGYLGAMSCILLSKAKLLSRLSIVGVLVAAFCNLSSMRTASQSATRTNNRGTTVVPPEPDLYHYQHWKNDLNVVHVVQTRFMQHQPNLLHLGRARLALFETFCLPTIVNQTTQQFLWIIRADENLRQELRESLINTVRGYKNIVVVGSSVAPDGTMFRHNGTSDITNHSLWYGNMDVVQEYHRASQTRIVVETGLDADDGIALDLLERLQRLVAVRKGSTWWRIYCLTNHTEWLYFNPYKNYPVKDAGHLRKISVQSVQVCITPGLTRASAANAARARVSTKSRPISQLGNHYFERHDQVRKLKQCSKQYRTACWSYLPSASINERLAIRSRTPTSAGMKGVSITYRNEIDEEDLPWVMAFWNDTMKTFSLDENKIRRLRREMQSTLPNILDDAIEGQCTKGHSCKNTSTQVLQELLQTSLASRTKRRRELS